MAYDAMGNYTGEDYETEEERRRRLAAEQANAVVQSTTVKTFGDGTKEETTKRTVAGPVAPDQSAAETARLQQQNAAPGRPVQDYLQYVRQNESGGNYNIGYHYQPNAQGQRTSTAYGAYGITAPAYQDIQAADPYFQGRNITALTPEDQDRAAQVYRQVQERQLAAKGQEPTEANLRGAQYAGAGGMSQFNRTGQAPAAVNPAILQQRMEGAAAPASGAARPLPPNIVRDADGTLRMTAMPGQEPAAAPTEAASPYALTAPSGQGLQVPGVSAAPQPAANPYITAYQQAQDDIMGLLPIAKDMNAPQWVRERASQRAVELNRQELEERRAKEQVGQMSPNEIGRALQSKSGEGSWLKAILFGILGMENSQKEEAAKLGIGKWETSTITGPEGESINVEVKRAPNGRILEGNKMDGTPLTASELSTMTVAGKGFKPEVSGTAYVKKDAEGNVIMRGVRTTVTRGDRTITKIESGGKTYDINAGWEPESISTAGAKAVQGKQISLAYDPLIKAATTSAEKLTEAGIKYGLNLYSPGVGSDGKPIIVDRNTDKIIKPDAQGMVTLPSALPAGGTAALESGQKLATERGQGVIKAMDEEIRPQAQAGDTVSSVRKQQFAIFDRPGVDANKIFGLATGAGQSPGDQKWTILRDIFSGAVASNADGSPMNGQQLSQRLQGLNLTGAEISALAEYNIANQKINAATLKQTAGPGSVSNAEQQANRESNVDPTKIPALGAYNAMAQSQFDGDRARYKADWAAGKDFKTALEMDKEWRKENQRLSDLYAATAKERIKYINANGNTTAAVKEGYKRFPVPEYDPATESWKKTKSLGAIFGG